MDAHDVGIMRRTAHFEVKHARERALLAIERMTRALEAARLDIEKGGTGGHESANMGAELAQLCKAGGQIAMYDALSDFLKEGT